MTSPKKLTELASDTFSRVFNKDIPVSDIGEDLRVLTKEWLRFSAMKQQLYDAITDPKTLAMVKSEMSEARSSVTKLVGYVDPLKQTEDHRDELFNDIFSCHTAFGRLEFYTQGVPEDTYEPKE